MPIGRVISVLIINLNSRDQKTVENSETKMTDYI